LTDPITEGKTAVFRAEANLMMMDKKLVRAAVLTFLVAGCGGGGGAPVTESDFCLRKAEAECQVTARCASSMSACINQRMGMCTQFAMAAKMGTRVFTPGNVNACIDKTRSVYAKTSPITPQDLADVDDACNYVFQGTGVVQVNMCTVKYDCKDRVICDKDYCATATTKSSGQPCGNAGEVCATGSYCADNAAGNKVCTPKAMTGTACSATVPCLESLRCSNGTCTDRVAANGTCTSNDDCATAAPYCDPYAPNRCTPGLSFATGAPACADFGGTTTAGTAGTSGGAGGAAGGAGGSAGGAAGSGGTGGGAAGTGGTGGGAAGTGGGAAGSGGAAGGAAGTGG
jgi:hypothetical protein